MGGWSVAKNRRQAEGKSPQETLINALNHPVRVKALTILSERVASPKEIASQIDVKLSSVSYHVRVLHALRVIEVAEERPVRGAVAHYYKAVAGPLIEAPDWQELDPRVRSAFSGHVIEVLMSDVAKSLAAGVFDRRADRHLNRTPLRLDEEGWRNVSEIQTEAEERILRAQAAAAARMNGAGSEAINAVAGMFCFEVPPSTES
jgi:DNA-binding transcriptional ArsR family regulator